MANIYETRLAKKDILYADWICKVNYMALMNTGVGIHENSKMTPQRMRRWYLAGVDAYTAAQRLNRSGR